MAIATKLAIDGLASRLHAAAYQLESAKNSRFPAASLATLATQARLVADDADELKQEIENAQHAAAEDGDPG